MGHLGERHHRPSFAGSRVSFPEGRLDREEEAAARRVFHPDESAQSQFLRYAFLRLRALELFEFGRQQFLSKTNDLRRYLRALD